MEDSGSPSAGRGRLVEGLRGLLLRRLLALDESRRRRGLEAPPRCQEIEIAELCKGVHCVDLGESFQTYVYLQKLFGFDTAENEPSKVWPPRTAPLSEPGEGGGRRAPGGRLPAWRRAAPPRHQLKKCIF